MDIWAAGESCGEISNVSSLDITSDDSVNFIATYRSGLRVSVHLDIFGRPHEKSFLVIGEKGNIVWTEEKNEVSVLFHDKSVEKKKFENERNDMFIELAKEFVSVMRGAAPNTCRLGDGVNVLKVVEAVRESSMSMRSVEIS